MSEPTLGPASSGDAPQPFAPAPAMPAAAGGCGKPVLIGCGVVFLLLGIAGVALIFKAKDLLLWSLERVRPAVLAAAAADVTPADKQRFETAFDTAVTQIKAGKMDPIALQSLQGELAKTMDKTAPGSIDRDHFLRLTEAFERMAGLHPDAPAEAPPEKTAPPAASPPPAGDAKPESTAAESHPLAA